MKMLSGLVVTADPQKRDDVFRLEPRKERGQSGKKEILTKFKAKVTLETEPIRAPETLLDRLWDIGELSP